MKTYVLVYSCTTCHFVMQFADADSHFHNMLCPLCGTHFTDRELMSESKKMDVTLYD